MKRTPLSLIAHWAGGELHGEDIAIDAMGHDTRALQAGALYVALRGEQFDGHGFINDALAHGASALLVDHVIADINVPQIVVADTQVALAKIAHGFQQGRTGKVIAITGSNGKTSVKSLLMSILQRAGDAYCNPGNRNNEIGLPLAVIDAPDDAQFAVYEMGAGKPGDIAYLTDVVRPDVALVNNIAPAHLQRMGSLLGVAETKGAVYTALNDGGIAVVNADDAFAEYFVDVMTSHSAVENRDSQKLVIPAKAGIALESNTVVCTKSDSRLRGNDEQKQYALAESRIPSPGIIRFSLENTADVTARDIRVHGNGSDFQLITPQGEAQVALRLPGRHNVLNALAAASLALACGVALPTIAEGLNAAEPVKGRLISHTLNNGAVLIDDSYNANPGSLAAAIDTLALGGGESWLVLGDMRELGEEAEALHADAGHRAKNAGITRLYALGELSAVAARAFGEGARVFDSHAEVVDVLIADMGVLNPVILVKGSRGSAMDKIVSALLAQGDTTHVA
jgi:UDP-N-acetylmuramoyl-tripeptide--D-alanyl-D-alanine ligase